MNLTYWYHSTRHSGKLWTWSSVFVPKPLEAWLFVLKLLVALLFILPPMLAYERIRMASVMPKLGWPLIAATIFAAIPVAVQLILPSSYPGLTNTLIGGD